MKTIICDIDGTLIYHKGSQRKQITEKPEILPGVIDKFHEWDKLGYNIVLITGRKESTRKKTEEQLQSLGIIYDKLVLGVGRGQRVLINDLKPDSEKPTAISVNLKRNTGFLEMEEI